MPWPFPRPLLLFNCLLFITFVFVTCFILNELFIISSQLKQFKNGDKSVKLVKPKEFPLIRNDFLIKKRTIIPFFVDKNLVTLYQKEEENKIQTTTEKKLLATVKKTRRPTTDRPGENGSAVFLSNNEILRAAQLFGKESFNLLASNKISVERSLPDVRNPECKKINYGLNLPKASVIVIFYNEPWSTLLRTVHSIYNRTPPKLLHEIILVNDFSDRKDVMPKLPHYIENNFFGKAKILHLKKREGLVRARLQGARVASGDVLVFLDAHCEVNVGWLEPLVARIKEDDTIVVNPVIDMIQANTMYYSRTDDDMLGTFHWDLKFDWSSRPFIFLQNVTKGLSPMKTPTMAGGLFAIDRKYFWNIGSYDEGMEIWGGENLEMSFRVWMCGGSLEVIPCSRVGHIFHHRHPYPLDPKKDVIGYNAMRVAEVWLDNYKKIFYRFRSDLKNQKYGDISRRIDLRKRLKCENFEWYLNNIYPDKFVFNRKARAWGYIKGGPVNCVGIADASQGGTGNLALSYCSPYNKHQIFSFTEHDEIREEVMCLDSTGRREKIIQQIYCHSLKGNQKWIHAKNGPIIHAVSGLCMDRDKINAKGDILLNKCNGKETQSWEFEFYL